MADNYIQVAPNSTGLKVDTSELTVSSVVVERQNVCIADPAAAANVAAVTAAGAVKVDASATTQPVSGTFYQTTQPVSGTITANAGTGLFNTSDGNAIAIGSTTSGEKGFLELAATTTTAPSYTTNTSNPLSTNLAGGLRVDGSGVTQPVSGTFYQSTQPVSIAASVPVTGTFWQTTQPISGSVSISGTPAVTATDNLTQVGGSALSLGQTTMTASLPVTLASNQSALAVTGAFYQATQPVSIAASVPVTGTFYQATQPVSIASALAVTGTFYQTTQPVSIADQLVSGSVTILNSNLATGTATTGSTVATAALNSNSAVAIQVTGTWTGTLAPQASLDGVNWVNLSADSTLNDTTGVYSATIASASVGIWQANVAGYTYFRMTASAAVTGTAVVTIRATNGHGPTSLDSPIPAGANVVGAVTQSGTWNVGTITTLPAIPTGANTIGVVNQGSAAVVANSWFAKLSDGTNGPAAIKAASTAAVATDPALVVQISPSNPALTVQPGNTANTTPWLTSQSPSTSGGLTPYKLISAATTNATSVKATAGQLYNVQAFNTGASAAFLKIYNLATAPTVGTTVPVATYLIPISGSGVVIEISNGMALSAGLAISINGGIVDSDTTAVAVSQVVVNLQYK